MWNFFKNKRIKKEQERLLAEKKVLELKKELKAIEEKFSVIADKKRRENREKVEKENSVCPKCKSTNVNDRIKRHQGSIDGKFEGSGWNALTFGSSYSYGRIKGEFDTNEVNKCNDCEHEWKKTTAENVSTDDVIQSEINSIFWLLKDYKEAREVTFDALDVKEEYNSFEEKKIALTNIVNNNWRNKHIKEKWQGTSLDVVYYLKQKNKWYNTNTYVICPEDEKVLLSLGFKKI